MIRLRMTGLGCALALAGSVFACSSTSGPSKSTGGGIGDGMIPGDTSNSGDGKSGGPTSAAGDSPGASGGGAGAGAGTGSGSGSSGGSGGSGGSSGAGSTSTGGNGAVDANILTAGSWDDNRNFDLFETFLTANAGLHGRPPIDDSELRDAFTRWSAPRAAKTTLDVSLVLDTTGSMGDEIAYLSSEFLALHASIEAKYPGADQRWSLVAYKDVHDPYIVEWFDFRTDPNDFVSHLASLSAGGGGDTPESPERALAITSQLGWRDDATAKLAFWISDAPHHDQDAAAMAQSLRDIRGRGIHLYPVMASGADDLTELTMRTGAEMTGGRLLFLTDDSGVGNSHAVPRIPCFFVTKLNDAVSRMVDIELTGVYREPAASEVLRTAGDPHSGRCTLSDGQTVSVF